MHERCILKLKIYTKIKRSEKSQKTLRPFHATVPFLHPLKATENHRFSGIFMGYENEKLALTVLNSYQHSDFVYFNYEYQMQCYFQVSIRDHSFSTYAKFSEKLRFFNPWYAHVHVHARGVGHVSFSKNFACIVNEWSLNDDFRFLMPWFSVMKNFAQQKYINC